MKTFLIMFIIIFAVGICFATDYITLSDYERASRDVSVDRQNISVLLSRVNVLLTEIRAPSVTINSAACTSGSPTFHPRSRAIDIQWNENLYNNIVANINESGLRIECIECIRQEGSSTGHIHLDIGGPNGEGLPLGRLFHIETIRYNIPELDVLRIKTHGRIVRGERDYIYLKLHRPVILISDTYTETVNEIQLIYHNNISFNVNQSYYIEGEAFVWQTAHHLTPIILSVDRISQSSVSSSIQPHYTPPEYPQQPCNILLISYFQAGMYYVQIGAYSNIQTAYSEIDKIGNNLPVAIMQATVRINNITRNVNRVLIGPLNYSDSVLILQQYRLIYRDAFVWSGR